MLKCSNLRVSHIATLCVIGSVLWLGACKPNPSPTAQLPTAPPEKRLHDLLTQGLRHEKEREFEQAMTSFVELNTRWRALNAREPKSSARFAAHIAKHTSLGSLDELRNVHILRLKQLTMWSERPLYGALYEASLLRKTSFCTKVCYYHARSLSMYVLGHGVLALAREGRTTQVEEALQVFEHVKNRSTEPTYYSKGEALRLYLEHLEASPIPSAKVLDILYPAIFKVPMMWAMHHEYIEMFAGLRLEAFMTTLKTSVSKARVLFSTEPHPSTAWLMMHALHAKDRTLLPKHLKALKQSNMRWTLPMLELLKSNGHAVKLQMIKPGAAIAWPKLPTTRQLFFTPRTASASPCLPNAHVTSVPSAHAMSKACMHINPIAALRFALNASTPGPRDPVNVDHIHRARLLMELDYTLNKQGLMRDPKVRKLLKSYAVRLDQSVEP